MARKAAGGTEDVQRAEAAVKNATTVAELRMAQAALLPLLLGLSVEQTARAIGRSPAWTSRLRTAFLGGECSGGAYTGRGGRRHSLMSVADEIELVKQAVARCYRANWHGSTVRHELRKLLEARFKERFQDGVPESTLTTILGRAARTWFADGKPWHLQRYQHRLLTLWAEEAAARRS